MPGRSDRTVVGDLAREVLQRFPAAPTKTLARKLHRQHPEVFLNLVQAESALRYYRGASGTAGRRRVRSRVDAAVRTPEQAAAAKTMPAPRLPESCAAPYVPHVLAPGQAVRVAVFADVHVPYHDRRAVEAAIRGARARGRPDIVLLNGDLIDAYALSRWEKDPRRRRFIDEIAATAELIAYLRSQLRPEQIVWKLGNHEERYWAYLQARAPDLLDLPQFQPEAVYGLADAGAVIVGERRVLQLGKLSIVHGHEFPTAVLGPVNAARGYFLRAKGNILGSHYHQKSEHFEPNIKDEELAAWCTGCLCDLHPDYARLNRWSHGWAWLETETDGTFRVDNIALPR